MHTLFIQDWIYTDVIVEIRSINYVVFYIRNIVYGKKCLSIDRVDRHQELLGLIMKCWHIFLNSRDGYIFSRRA